MRKMIMGVAGTVTLVAGMVVGVGAGTAQAANPASFQCAELVFLGGSNSTHQNMLGLDCQEQDQQVNYRGSGEVFILQNARNSWDCRGSLGTFEPVTNWTILANNCADTGGG